MSTQRFTPEFKEEAVKQVIDRGYGVPDVAARLGVSAHSLYKWVKAVSPDKSENASTKRGTSPEPMSSTISRRSITEPAATAISAASVPRRSKAPRREAGNCLPNQEQSNFPSLVENAAP